MQVENESQGDQSTRGSVQGKNHIIREVYNGQLILM